MYCDINMRPSSLVDMTKDESMQCLRHLELEAFSRLVSALRAQGSLNPYKEKLLKETGYALNISQRRQIAEVRRALTDEKLNTIAYHMCDQNEYADEWCQEGQSRLSLTPRLSPETAFSTIAEDVSENSNQNFKQAIANIERKRTPIQINQPIDNKTNFRVPEPKHEENRKRKISDSSNNLAQYILGPSKISKIQQIYRQKTKSKMKEQQLIKAKAELEQQEIAQNKIQHPVMLQKPMQTIKLPLSAPMTPISTNGSKIYQNVNFQSVPLTEDQTEQVQDINYVVQKFNEQNHITSQPSIISDNLKNRLKLLPKSNNNIMFKPVTTAATNIDLQKTLRKTITKTVPTTGQKLIVVSSSQSIPTSSILQRTLSLPIVKNGDKFKIVSSSSTPITLTNSIANTNNLNSVKHKIVTVRTNNQVSVSNKVFPLTQLQMLNKANIKVLPIGGKIISKTNTSTPSSVFVVNNIGNLQPLKSVDNLPVVSASKFLEKIDGVSSTAEIIVDSTCTKNFEHPNNIKNSQIVLRKNNSSISEDYDSKIDEFHIQTVGAAENTIVNEIQSEEVVENMEIDQSDMLCLPQIECTEIVKTSEMIDFNHLSSISSEVEVENTVYTQLVSPENQQN